MGEGSRYQHRQGESRRTHAAHPGGTRLPSERGDAEPVLLSRSLLACTPGLRGSFLDLLSPA